METMWLPAVKAMTAVLQLVNDEDFVQRVLKACEHALHVCSDLRYYRALEGFLVSLGSLSFPGKQSSGALRSWTVAPAFVVLAHTNSVRTRLIG